MKKVDIPSFDRYAATSPEVEERGWNGYYLQDPVSCDGESITFSFPPFRNLFCSAEVFSLDFHTDILLSRARRARSRNKLPIQCSVPRCGISATGWSGRRLGRMRLFLGRREYGVRVFEMT